MDIAFVGAVVIAVAGFFMGLIGWLLNRSIKTVDSNLKTLGESVASVDASVIKLDKTVARLPTWGEVKTECKEIADNRIIRHERDLHPGQHAEEFSQTRRT